MFVLLVLRVLHVRFFLILSHYSWPVLCEYVCVCLCFLDVSLPYRHLPKYKSFRVFFSLVSSSSPVSICLFAVNLSVHLILSRCLSNLFICLHHQVLSRYFLFLASLHPPILCICAVNPHWRSRKCEQIQYMLQTFPFLSYLPLRLTIFYYLPISFHLAVLCLSLQS